MVNCTEHSFNCINDNICIPDKYKCDGKDDCTDGSDELFCGVYLERDKKRYNLQ